MNKADLDLFDSAITDLRAKWAATVPPVLPPGPTNGPLPRRLLASTDLQYVRSFRLPAGLSNGQSFSFGGEPLALDTRTNTLLIGNRGNQIAEVTIPAEPGAFAEYVQGFMDPSEGKLTAMFGDQASLWGVLVVGEFLLCTVIAWYDGNGTQEVGHFIRPRNPSDRGHVSALFSVWHRYMTGFVAGNLAHVPFPWQAALGGSILTGQCCIPIVSRTSWGPSAFSIDVPINFETIDVLPATPLVYYTGEHPTLGKWEKDTAPPNPLYGSTTKCRGLAIIDGTRTALFFGRTGLGTQTYGNGTSQIDLAGRLATDGEVFCYDPSNADKGQHAYPYRYQVWAYNLDDFALVAAGELQPWEIEPYGVWGLELPTPEPEFRGIGGIGYDPATSLLYLSQLNGDKDGYAYRPMMHVLRVGR